MTDRSDDNPAPESREADHSVGVNKMVPEAGQREGVEALIPERLVELSKIASHDWELGNNGIIRGGDIQHFERGSGRTQIAMFSAPRDDSRDFDPVAEQRANAELAHGCVTFVRDLIARRLASAQQPSHTPDAGKMVASAMAVIKRWESPLWKQETSTAELINKLRKDVDAYLRQRTGSRGEVGDA